MNGEFERLIKTIFESPARAALSNHAWTPPLDVWETEGELVYAFDLEDSAAATRHKRRHLLLVRRRNRERC